MKIRAHSRANRAGSILMVTVWLSFIIGIALVACLSLVNSQSQSVARSQVWNTCIPVVEAGIEEAMAHLNNRLETSYGVNGWVPAGTTLNRERYFADSFYAVQIAMADPFQPTIVCTGYVRMPSLVAGPRQSMLAAAAVSVGGLQYISRAVRVVAKKEAIFAKGMVARDHIQMNGNNIDTDSFNSGDPNYSTDGIYDPAKASDHGDVATTSGLTNSIGIGNANILGRLSTGPDGTVTIGPNGVVGSMAWHTGGNSGIEPGWARDDMNISFSDVKPPFNGGAFAPISGTVTGVVYKYLLADGNYEMSTLNLKNGEFLAVIGNATLLVDGDVDVRGGIDILPGGSLNLYVAGSSTSIGGKGVNNTGQATNFVYFGLPGNTSLSLPSNGDFTGAIYAPGADFALSGGGSAPLSFSGACVTRTISINGHYKFHYDEALGAYGPWQDYVIISWVEL